MKGHKEINEFSLLEAKNLDEELKEITSFFDQVGTVKGKILKDKESSDLKSEIYLKDDKIIDLLYKNANIFNVITEDTIKSYIDTFFEKHNNDKSLFKFTDEDLETFLTSILIFKQD